MDILDQTHIHAWIHCLVTTKDKKQILLPHFRDELNQIVEDTLIEMGCGVHIINSSTQHLNCLYNMSAELSVQQNIDRVREVTSIFVNSKLNTQEQEIWDEAFNCISVDSTNIDEVFTFIRDQELRNLKETDKSELKQLLELHKVSIE